MASALSVTFQTLHTEQFCHSLKNLELFLFYFFRFGFSSVSSFVKKTTEKINTLQMNSELRQRPEFRENVQAETAALYSEETDHE